MSNVKLPKFRGFSSYQIKLFAVVFMTIDHLAAYGHEIPIFYTHYNLLRTIGRIAAPLLLSVAPVCDIHWGVYLPGIDGGVNFHRLQKRVAKAFTLSQLFFVVNTS